MPERIIVQATTKLVRLVRGHQSFVFTIRELEDLMRELATIVEEK